ncbi:helix-turn-helix domain-containing protein [Paraburkholderia bonniea]|uniref:TrmB family transcriptional regulator n=1 Tax=Paraburkholderia bonniea TaxID=2152891 RepID=UPI0025723501|nr:helix-turn-helix domain-containing protein [Paraburkholderia bonniea]WJF90270.1 helix-turn-helix domain-containing protein [Paraburkholderia bonniea]WJF93585.1 helix-turn-helix domain-containing protein [Paraburkholderia bonniea]
MVEQTIEPLLGQLGLDGNRARFYLAALELGEASIADISRRAGIGRTNAYEVVERLIADGLISRISRGPRSYVQAQDPLVLLRRIEEQRLIAQSLVPQLRSLHQRGGSKPQVRYFEGIEGITEVLYDTLSCQSGELCGVLAMAELLETPGQDVMQRYIQARIKAGLNLRVVRSESREAGLLWPASHTERRYLRYAPSTLDLGMTSYVYDDKVAYISSRREHYALCIESAEFAAFQRAMFEGLWHTSTPVAPQQTRVAATTAKTRATATEPAPG